MAKILVVEDDRQHRIMAAMVLKKCSHEVVEAADARSGLEAVKRHHPDLVVSDIRMPGLTGYDLVSKLRQDPATANLPVILVTGHADLAGLRRGMSLGADDYLPKPFTARDLMDAVETRLRRIRDLISQVAPRPQEPDPWQMPRMKTALPDPAHAEDANWRRVTDQPLVWIGSDEPAVAESLSKLVETGAQVRARVFDTRAGKEILGTEPSAVGLIAHVTDKDSAAFRLAVQAAENGTAFRVVTLVPPDCGELVRNLMLAGCDVVVHSPATSSDMLRKRLLSPMKGLSWDAGDPPAGDFDPELDQDEAGPGAATAAAGEAAHWESRGQILGLSPREASIMGRLAAGDRYQDIADTLGCSINTIRTHLKRIYRKLGVVCRTSAVARLAQSE